MWISEWLTQQYSIQYISNNPSTRLMKFYGLHSIKMHYGDQVPFYSSHNLIVQLTFSKNYANEIFPYRFTLLWWTTHFKQLERFMNAMISRCLSLYRFGSLFWFTSNLFSAQGSWVRREVGKEFRDQPSKVLGMDLDMKASSIKSEWYTKNNSWSVRFCIFMFKWRQREEKWECIPAYKRLF